MPYISKFKLPNSQNVYDLKDANVRALLGFKDYEAGTAYNKGDYLFYNNGFYIVNESIAAAADTQFADVDTTLVNSVGADILARYDEIKALIAGGIHYIGYTTTVLIDGATTNPITIDGGDEPDYSYTAKSGDLVIYVERDASGPIPGKPEQEFIFNGTHWNEFGSTGALKALAFADTASTTYTPQGSINLNIQQGSTDVDVTREDYTPAGNIKVTDPTITLSSATSGGVKVVTGVKTGGTDTLNKVSQGTAITVGKKAATSTTVGNANVGAQVTVATGLKNTGDYATTFATSGISDVSVITDDTDSKEFSVPTNAASGVTLTENASTSDGAIEYTKSVAMNTSKGYATNFFAGATVDGETLTFASANVGVTGTTKYMTAPAVAAQKQGYKLSKTNADTKNVGVDTDTVNKVSESTAKIFGVGEEATFTPVIVGDSVTVIKDLDTTHLVASATGGAASFNGTNEPGLKITSLKYDKVKDTSSANFNGTAATIRVNPDTTQSGE